MVALMPQESFFAQWFFGLPAELMTALGTVLGFALLGDLTAGQQNSLGNFLMLIAQVLETNSAQNQLKQELTQNRQIADLQRTVDELRTELADLQNRFTPPHPR